MGGLMGGQMGGRNGGTILQILTAIHKGVDYDLKRFN